MKSQEHFSISIFSLSTCIIFILFIISAFFSKELLAIQKVNYPLRRSILEGKWYPKNPKSLRKSIDKYLSSVNLIGIPRKEPKIIVVPHAGHIYSGHVAAYAYALLRGKKFNPIFILAPSHHVMFRGGSIPLVSAYETPLGKYPVAIKEAKSLIDKYELFSYIKNAHRREHSIEIQIPFLQIVQPGSSIVPILIGNRKDIRDIANILINELKNFPHALILVSTDLSHFHNAEKAVVMDKRLIVHVLSKDINGLYSLNNSRRIEACGIAPLLIALTIAKEFHLEPRLLKYAHSGHVTGDNARVVGYASMAFFPGKEEVSGRNEKFRLTEKDGKILLKLARLSLDVHYGKISGRKIEELEKSLPSSFKQKFGLFVTLKKNGRLRGCIGSIYPNLPLYRLVQKMAIAAATIDPRFRKVSKDELNDLSIEISILTPLREVDDPVDILLGRDGLFIKSRYRSGLLLPQVPLELGWDKKKFLEHTCLKAGLAPNTWRSTSAKLYTFSAEIFSEDD